MSRARWMAPCLLILLAGCKSDAPAPASSEDAAKSPVAVTTIHPQAVVDRLDLPARVELDPARLVRVYSQVAGRLVQLQVRPGQEVAKGEAIGTIQSSDIDEARSDYDKAQIEAARADRQLDRARLLLQHEVMAQRDYDDTEAADKAAHAELTRALQRIRMLGFSPEGSSDTVALRAPISGAVLETGSASGEMQRSLDNATPIVTLGNLDSVWIVGDVFERELGTVVRGKTVDVTFAAYPGETRRGVISNISDTIDPATRTLKVRVVLPNPGHRLKPEMFATISIARSAGQAFVLPATAVIHEGPSSYVFLEKSPGSYDRRPVTTGSIHDQTIVVTAGLNDGDRIVTAGAALLRPPTGD